MPFEIQASWDPIIARFGTFELGWHGVFAAIALFVGIYLAEALARRRNIPTDRVTGVVPWAVAGALIGARLFHVADHWDFYSEDPFRILAIWEGGIAVYGAFVGGVLAGVAFAMLRRWPVSRLLDIAAPAILIGQAIGRIGCFSNGDATGAACGSPVCGLIAVTYTNANDLLPDNLRNVPTHPYPLYEIAGCFVVLAILWAVRPWTKEPGQQFAVAVFGYALVRLILAMFRDENILAFGLQQAQVVSILTMILTAVYLLWRLFDQARSRRTEVVSGA